MASIGLVFPCLQLAGMAEGDEFPKMVQWVISQFGFINEDNVKLVVGSATVVGLLGSSLIGFLSDIYKSRYIQFTNFRIGLHTLEIISQKPYIYFVNNNSSMLIKKLLQDITLFTTGILIPIVEAFSKGVLAILLISVLFIANDKVTFLAIALFGIPLLLTYLFLRNKVKGLDGKRNYYVSRRVTSAITFFQGIKPILASNKKDYFIKKYAEETFNLAMISTKFPVLIAGPKYLLEALAFSSIIGIILYFQLSNTPLEVILPTLILFSLSGYRLLPALQFIYSSASSIGFSRKAMDEIYEEVFVTEAGYSSKAESSNWRDISKIKGIHFNKQITIENLSFAYPNTSDSVLKEINLTIPKGSKIAFCGRTGSGKSTLIDIILGLFSADNGTIYADTVAIDETNLVSWRKTIGYVPQDIFLTDEPLYQNIAFGVQKENIDMGKVQEAARRAQLITFVENELPEGFDTVVGERGVRLSGGQKQRIGLARALYFEPEILILDEATSALDNNTENAVMHAINELGNNITTIMVAHRLSTVESCDTIYFLDHGEIQNSGKYHELIQSNSEFAEMNRH